MVLVEECSLCHSKLGAKSGKPLPIIKSISKLTERKKKLNS